MNAKVLTATYEIIEKKGNLDCAEFSLCPNCSLHIIKLADGCSACGWSNGNVLQGGLNKSSSNLSKCSSTLEKKLAIPCLIKQPSQPEVRGLIQKDLGDSFTVYIPSDNSTVTVPKLLVYPDFSSIGDELLKGGLAKSSSNCSSTLNNCSSKNDINKDVKVSDICEAVSFRSSAKCSSNSDNPPSICEAVSKRAKTNKTRRQKGEGSGHIYYRTVTRNGRKYRQAYYQWRENGKQRTKYIPKKLLHHIEEAEAQKLPITEILEILQGGLKKCSSNCSSTSTKVLAKHESDKTLDNCSLHISNPPSTDLGKEIKDIENKHLKCSSNSPEDVLAINESVGTIEKCSSNSSNPPSKRKKRSSGYGGGYVEYREVKRNHKVYAQYWYHYEFWEKGDRVTKKSKYIPKRLRSRVEKMNNEKVPVAEILRVLKGKNK